MLQYLKNKTAEWDCDRQWEDVFIEDWIFGRHPELEEVAKRLMKKQNKDDKNIFRRFVWWLTRDIPKFDKIIEYDEELPFDELGNKRNVL